MGAPPDLRARPRGGAVPPPSPPSASPSPSPLLPPLPPQLPFTKPSPLTSPLPSLRVLLHPIPGLGLDIRVPLSRRTRCYMQLDSFFNAPSSIRIGVHPRNHAGMRLQLSPQPRLTARVPLRIGGARYVHLGGYVGLGGGGGGRVWETGWGKMSAGFSVEIWRYTTGAGLVDERVRTGVREVLGKGRKASRLDGSDIDPRERDEVVEIMKQVLRERNGVRERRTGIPAGSVVGKDGRLVKGR